MSQVGYILGIDYGDKRVGLALAHSIAKLPQPLKTIENNDKLISDLVRLCESEQIVELVVGFPRNMDGTTGEQAHKTQDFASDLASATKLPCSLVEEALSSVEAGTRFPGVSVDSAAAAIILERYFEEGLYSTGDEHEI